MKLPPEKVVKEFLRESNAIEGVYDEDSFNQTMYAWDYLYNQTRLTVGDILRTHKILMLKTNLQPYERGYFRTREVRVGNHYGLNHILIREAIGAWLDAANISMKNEKDVEALERRSRGLHVEFERIHPFVDGNGRTGRMFMNFMRVKQFGLPLLVIKESEREDYYKWFH